MEVLDLPDGRGKGTVYSMMATWHRGKRGTGYIRHLSERQRTETPEAILSRLAAQLNCKPEQACDIVIRMLKERVNEHYTEP